MPAHEFRSVRPSLLPGHLGWVYAVCWCGWESRDADSHVIAEALHGEHVAYATEGPKLVRE